jgi:hypothetical protein
MIQLKRQGELRHETKPYLRSGKDAANHWAIMWTRDRSLFFIYGPDREHVIDYYQKCHSGEAKRRRETNIPGVVLNSLFKGLTTARGFKNMRALISATVLITILLPSPRSA